MRCQDGCALGVKISAQGTLVLEIGLKDKAALLIMLPGHGGGALHRFECGCGVALLLCGVVAGGVLVKK